MLKGVLQNVRYLPGFIIVSMYYLFAHSMDSKRSQVEKYRNVIVRNLIPSHVLPHLLTIQAIHGNVLT